MAAMLLSDALKRLRVRSEFPGLRYEFNGDGGNEVFRDYPLAGHVTLQDVLRDPHLYLLGYKKDALAVDLFRSAGLSRAYVRTFNPARLKGVLTFSPLIDRRVIEIGQCIPLNTLVGDVQALSALRPEVVGSA